VVGLNTYRLYRYYQLLKVNKWDQYGNVISVNLNETEKCGQIDLKILFTQEELKQQNASDQYQTKNTNEGTRRYKNDVEPSQLRRVDRKKSRKPEADDYSLLDWQQNKLVEDDNDNKNDTTRDGKNSKFPALMREGKPSSQKEHKENRLNEGGADKGNTANRLENQNLEESVHNEDTKRNSENIFENPYDEKGYAMSSPKGERDNSLDALRMKYKQDFSSRVVAATLREK
jgi:hypothetical protein